MRDINITLNLYSAVVCIILFLYLCFRKNRGDKMRRNLALMCFFNCGMLLGDTVSWALGGGSQPWCHGAMWAANLLYYLSSGPLLLAFAGYVIACIASETSIGKGAWYTAVFLCACQVIFSTASIWTNMYFTISADNLYVRGELFLVGQMIPFLVYGMVAFLMIRYSRYLKRRNLLFLSSHIFFPLVAEVIQILNYGIATLNTGVTLALFLVFINIQLARELRIEQQEKALAEARIDIMLSQIQPHFLYNTLTAIRRLCGTDPEQAKAAILDFSVFLRGNMNALTSKAPIPFEQERAHTEKYVSLERQRAPELLRVVYKISVSAFSIPPLTLQPIVENAVHHGVLGREEGGTVTISTRETQGAYLIEVSDDGVGFQADKVREDEEIHVGISNVRKRLMDICGGTLTIESRPMVGTVATIAIPKGDKI